MRTKVLGVNQRIKVGRQYSIGNDEKVLARVLRTVGLTLEVDVDKDHFVLFASRRPLTHDVESANATKPPKPVSGSSLDA